MKSKSIAGILFFFLLIIELRAEYAPNVSITTELDLLIYRVSARYGICIPDELYSRPVNYSAVNSFFGVIDSLDAAGVLSASEIAQVEKIKKQYSFTRNKIRYGNDTHDIHLKADLDLLGDIGLKMGDSTSVSAKGTISPSLKGNIGKLSFYSGIDVWTEYRSDTIFHRSSYQPYDGVAYNVYGRNTDETNVRSSDIPHGGIIYDAGRIKIETAIDHLRYGPAVYYPLTLSGMTPPITYARALLDMEIVDYSHTAGLLKSQKDLNKYIYTHRLDMHLLQSKLLVGINEVIINGSSTDQFLGDSNKVNPSDTGQVRGWEWVYLIPFVPFKFVEHYAGDRDNAALSIDFTIWYPQSFRWYGEFFLDDMLNPLKIFSNDWGNKWALTLGGQFFGQLLSKDIAVDIEYSHVEPWVYTHFFGGSHSYTHFGQSLGNPLGPNSQALTVACDVSINKSNLLQIRFTNIAKNSSVRGGTITDVFQDEGSDSTAFFDSETKEFLGNGTVWKSIPALQWSFFPSRIFNANMEYSLEITRGELTSKAAVWGGFHF